MTRILTKLRIDEISCVVKGSNPGAKVMIRKADDDTPFQQGLRNIFAKAFTPENRTNTIDDNKKLSGKLKEMVAAMVIADPSKTEEQHLFSLLHSPHGRRLAEHLNELSKKGAPMSRTEEMATMHKFIKSTAGGFTSIAKHIVAEGGTGLTEHEFTELWKSDAGGNSAFVKEFEGPRNERHDAYDVVHNASHLKAAGYPNLMSVEVVSTETGSTLTSSDAYKAADQLKALVEAQRAKAPTLTTEQLYDTVYRDPANRTITARAHPTMSSPSGDALQR
jgi:hypothetical protein